MLNIPKERLDQLKLVVFDSDGVSIPRGTTITERIDETGIELFVRTFVITEEFASLAARLSKRFRVAISSGRSLLYLQTMYGPLLSHEVALQAENGVVSLIDGTLVQHATYPPKYFALLSAIRDDLRKLPIKGIEPKQFIVSAHADREIPEVYDVIKHHDTEGLLRVMWNGEAFDIQHKDLSKGFGIRKMRELLGVSAAETLAIGDRVNDAEMLAEAGIAVSADASTLTAEFSIDGERPGETLARYLVETCGL